jgi:site-specific recombinase XerD
MNEGGEIYSAMSSTPDLPFAAADAAREFAHWLAYLSAERRMSAKTVEAYERDVRQFLAFLSSHLGNRVTLAALTRLKPVDVRAFMAARRSDGIASRSLMRMLAGARSFARFLERNGKGKVGALAAVRTPKLAKTLPKPLSIAAAKRITEPELRAGEERPSWVLARDAAVLALLYGCGLRISEALGLKRKDFPSGTHVDAITVIGKGNKARMVPVLAQVPTSLPPTARYSSAPRAARFRHAWCSLPWRSCAARSHSRRRPRRTPCAIRLRPICSRAAATCAPSRNCSATPRSPPRRSIRRSILSGCSTSIAARIPAPD